VVTLVVVDEDVVEVDGGRVVVVGSVVDVTDVLVIADVVVTEVVVDVETRVVELVVVAVVVVDEVDVVVVPVTGGRVVVVLVSGQTSAFLNARSSPARSSARLRKRPRRPAGTVSRALPAPSVWRNMASARRT
jgi:hypothetical protein